MSKYLLSLSLLFICFISPLQAQDFYLIDTLYNIWTGGTHNRTVININTCNISTTSTELFNPTGVTHSAPDMTFTGLSGPGQVLSLQFDNDPNNLVPDDLIVFSATFPFGGALAGAPFAPETLPNGISVDYNLVPYLVGNHLSRINGVWAGVASLGLLPVNQRPKGQMTFREGSFYYPSVNNELIQLKIAGNDFWMRALGSLPDTLTYGGIFSVPVSCDSTNTYIIHHGPNWGCKMFLLDIIPLRSPSTVPCPTNPMLLLISMRVRCLLAIGYWI